MGRLGAPCLGARFELIVSCGAEAILLYQRACTLRHYGACDRVRFPQREGKEAQRAVEASEDPRP